jgi:hypothetical protein
MTHFDNITSVFTTHDMNERRAVLLHILYDLDSETFKYHVDLKSNSVLILPELTEYRNQLRWEDAIFICAGEGACTHFELWQIGSESRLFIYDIYRSTPTFASIESRDGLDTHWILNHK